MSRIFKLALVLFALFLGLLFHFKNDQKIEIDYYVGNIELSLSLALVLFICAGAILGIIASLPRAIRLKRENLRLKKDIKQYKNKLGVMQASLSDTNGK